MNILERLKIITLNPASCCEKGVVINKIFLSLSHSLSLHWTIYIIQSLDALHNYTIRFHHKLQASSAAVGILSIRSPT
jgi:hypothetical protein